MSVRVVNHQREGKEPGTVSPFPAFTPPPTPILTPAFATPLVILVCHFLRAVPFRRFPSSRSTFCFSDGGALFPLGDVTRELKPVSLEAASEWCFRLLHPVSLSIRCGGNGKYGHSRYGGA